MIRQDFVETILQTYKLEDATYVLLADQWNTTYRITASTGQHYNLRICGEEFQDIKCLRDELQFVDFIAKSQQVLVPKPVRNLAGEFVTRVQILGHTRLCCIFEWIEGDVARGHLTIPLMRKIGRATAHLHLVIKTFRYPSEDDAFRPGYNFDEVLVASHKTWIEKYAEEIGTKRVELLNMAVERTFENIKALGKTRDNYGFIHADLHPGNFIANSGKVAIIDFDQLGRGHFCFDMAVMMVELFDEADQFEPLWASFKAGYQTVAPLPFDSDEELNPFIISVNLGFLDWVYNTPKAHVREQWLPKFAETYQSIQYRLNM